MRHDTIIYAVDAQGKKINTTQLPITNDGTFGHHAAFLPLLEMHLRKLGIQCCTQVLLLADGARWIWNKIPLLLQRLGCQQVTQLVTLFCPHIYPQFDPTILHCSLCKYHCNQDPSRQNIYGQEVESEAILIDLSSLRLKAIRLDY